MITDIFISIVKYSFLALMVFAMSVLFITMGAMTYGGIAESVNAEHAQRE